MESSQRSVLLHTALLSCAFILMCGGRAAAQSDISGVWKQPGDGLLRGGQYEDMWERCCGGGAGTGGPTAADFTDIPLNEAGRFRALTYEDSLWETPEHECQPHAAAYAYWGPGAPTISAIYKDQQLVAYHVEGTYRRLPREIWMDGRPHPPDYERHTWAGFTTGQWKGNVLVATTTHLKNGWVRRNGAPTSDQAKLLTYFTRHGDVLTITWFVDDPLYFTEPYIKSADFRLAANIPVAKFGSSQPPGPAALDAPYYTCWGNEEVPFSEKHPVPFWQPGENPSVGETATKLNIPPEAELGYAEVAYPEYIEKIKAWRKEHPAPARHLRAVPPPIGDASAR